MDVDEDGCLSSEEILSMIYKIERNFSRENSLISIDSQCLLFEIASKKVSSPFIGYNEILIYHLKS
jgi:hypothetical protein